MTRRPVDTDALAELAAEAFRATYSTVVDAATVEAVVAQVCTATAFRHLVQRAVNEPQERQLVAVEDGTIKAFLDFGEEPEGPELRRLYVRVGGTTEACASPATPGQNRS